MTVADEYQRALLPLLIAEYGEDAETRTEFGSLRRIAQALAADPGVRAAVVQWFVEYVATQCAYNGAADPGQRFYDEGLNQWLQQAAYDYSRQEPTDGE